MKVVKFFLVILIFNIFVQISNTITVNSTNKKLSQSKLNESLRSTKNAGKWQVGRVSRKQYEVVNMLWRKTKIFIEQDINSNTEKTTAKKSLSNKNSRHKNITLASKIPVKKSFLTSYKVNVKSSTPSYIEFYYLDNFDDRINTEQSNKDSDEYKIAFLRPPFFLFRVNDATCRPTKRNNSSTSLRTKSTDKILQHSVNKTSLSFNNASYKRKGTNRLPRNEMGRTLSSILTKGTITSNLKYTTSFDRIKFFEIYDSDTYTPHTLQLQNKRMISNDYVSLEEKNYIDYFDRNHDKFQHARKNLDAENLNTKESDDSSIKDTQQLFENLDANLTKTSSHLSRPAAWAEYPFIGVYVYEPEQVRCDCASVSSHWLIGAATCLHRYHKDFRADSRSAFVAYCSNNWRHPGRIAYVSKSLIHPEFQAKDYTRRQLYNIGVIQVVNSMANTCVGWQPIPLMSHHFAADRNGSRAIAVGWGLDRYDTRYTTMELPAHRLMLYEGLVYSDCCPGNIGYSKAKRLNGESIKNVYCLSLPPYIIEENDPVHGGLLLVGGKLIALYSQEERRSWGEQSAQYTGVWHLIPWLNDVARELDDPDSFDSDI